MYAYWVCAARETPIFSPEFPFRSISFSQIIKKSVPEHHHFTFFLADFAVPETIIFKISLISTRSSPPTAGSARTQSVRQRRNPRPFWRYAFSRSKRIKESHFHAQNGSSSFRSPAFSSSKRSSPTFSRSTGSPFRSPCQFFTLPRHIPTKIWGEYPPPPQGGGSKIFK